MKHRGILVVLVILLLGGAVYGKDRLAILPFSGGEAEDGETIAELFSFDPTINEAFTPVPRTSIAAAMQRERRFQMISGFADPDNSIALGRELGARYLIAGNITQLGERKLLVISILDTESLQMVAGDVQTYTSIEEMPGKLPAMAQTLVEGARRDTSKLTKLAVVPFSFSGNVEAGDVLAQLLSIYIDRYGVYAVYPRTKSLAQVQDEWKNQTSGNTADTAAARIGAGESPRYVLSGAARRLGTQTMFNASVIDLLEGGQTTGASVNYWRIDEGTGLMIDLAAKISGVPYFRVEWLERVQGHDYIIITGYNGIAQKINIPDHIEGVPVIGISSNAFQSKQLTSVSIPYSVTFIGGFAFYDNQLTSVTIPNSVTAIDVVTFGNNQLTHVTIPNSVTSIGNGAFSRNQLTSVTIPNSVTSIGNRAFALNRLTSVTIPNSVTSISEDAFSSNQLTSITIPNSVTSIGERAFAWNQLTGITIPNGVTSIGNGAFSGNQLTSVTIPNRVTSISDLAFSGNPLTSITMPNSVTSIGKYAFTNNRLTNASIPNSVTSIGEKAFYNNFENLLTNITIGANVTIHPDAFNNEFAGFYNTNGRLAGTYTYSGGKWSRK